MTDSLTVTLAAENVLDETPGLNPNARSGSATCTASTSRGGFNGRFRILKLTVE